MSRRFLDLSVTLDNDTIADPPFMRPRIGCQNHAHTMPELNQFFPGVLPSNCRVAGGSRRRKPLR